MTGWIPVFGQYQAEIAGFTYHAPIDAYPCAAGKRLPFRKYDTAADGHWLKIYGADCSDCQQCALKPTCVPGAKRKPLTRTLCDAAYRRAWQRQPRRRGQRLRRVRQGTIEPVFGHLLPRFGLRRMNVRGLAGAHKTRLRTAVAYHRKKRLKYRPQQQRSLAGALPGPSLAANRHYWRRNRCPKALTRALARWLLRN